MKLETAIQNGYQKLKNSNIKSALLDSELIMSNVINKSREYMILNDNTDISIDDYNNFQKIIDQRSRGRPIAYLTNKKVFWKYEFFVNKDVLIPRPDTEVIIEQVLEIYKNKNKINFLDIGFGSGCILLSILKECKNFMGTGIDISNKALKICNINAYKLGVKNRLKLFNSDIDKFTIGKYDLIISNPPYIINYKISYLDDDVKLYEPKVALDGGVDGYSEIKNVVKKSTELIKTKGKLIIEIGDKQLNFTKEILRRNGFYINKIVKDLAKKNRCIVSTKI